MFYPELLEIIDKTGAKELIEKIDRYFAFLPNKSQVVITASSFSNRFEIDFNIAETLLNFCYELELLEKFYIVCCPICGREVFKANKKELLEKISDFDYCIKCKHEISEGDIQPDSIYVGYVLVKSPDLDPEDISKETERILGNNYKCLYNNEVDTLRKLLEEKKEKPHDFFYNPSEVEYRELKEMVATLDYDYGDDTTKQGKALEGLACKLFELCWGMKSTPIMRTPTNQIDCTVRNDLTISLTLYNELGSIIKCECKNEPNKTPGNTYYQKLHGILSMSKNEIEQSVGIIFSRKKRAKTCKILEREYFLKDNIIIINLCNDDYKRIIDEKENFLDVIQEKVQNIKNNFSTDPEQHKLYRNI